MAQIDFQSCRVCGKRFPFNTVLYERLKMELPKRCPQCIDEEQKRPEVILSRTEIASFVVVIDSLPGELIAVPPKGRQDPEQGGSWAFTVKGNVYGKNFTGRIDLRASTERAPAIGDIVRVVEMQTQVQVGKRPWSRQTLQHGTVAGARTIPVFEVDLSQGDYLEEETHRYVRLDPTDEHPGGQRLVWIITTTKTTLKGFGLQYWETLEGAPVWKQQISGGVRSGRMITTGTLAIVSPNHQLVKNRREYHLDRGESFWQPVVFPDK
jgi:hypothetical protein